MAKTAIATQEIARGIEREGSRASSARFDTVSIPVYAIIATGIASANFDHVGATPQWMFDQTTCGLKMSAKPITTSSSFSDAASLIPTMLMPTRNAITIAPPTMSQGDVFSGSQKIDR